MRQTRRKVYGWRRHEGQRIAHRVIVGHRCFYGQREMEICNHEAPPTYVYRGGIEALFIRFSDWLGLGIDPPLRIMHGVLVQVVCVGEILCTFDSGTDWYSFPKAIRHIVSFADVQRAAHGLRVTLHRGKLRYVVRRKPEPAPTGYTNLTETPP
jgi:hypothetical protein